MLFLLKSVTITASSMKMISALFLRRYRNTCDRCQIDDLLCSVVLPQCFCGIVSGVMSIESSGSIYLIIFLPKLYLPASKGISRPGIRAIRQLVCRTDHAKHLVSFGPVFGSNIKLALTAAFVKIKISGGDGNNYYRKTLLTDLSFDSGLSTSDIDFQLAGVGECTIGIARCKIPDTVYFSAVR